MRNKFSGTVLIAFLLVFAAVLSSPVLGQELNCTSHHHKACSDSSVYWYDSCDNKQDVYMTCGWAQKCVNAQCINRCGDGICDPGDNCGNCQNDCQCGRYERCDGAMCRTYCGNGRCDGDETCGSCWSDCGCSSGEECVRGRCEKFCGNGRLDSGEDCITCPADVKCPAYSYCSPQAQCVECLKDDHCTSRDYYIDEFFCAPDTQHVWQKGIRKQGLCKGYTCTGEDVPISRVKENCGDKLCQDDHCGCNDGYAPCLATGKCERMNTLSENEHCSCDLQCKSGYCNINQVCINPLTIALSPTKNSLNKGESAIVRVTASNNLMEEINLNLVLNIGSGVKITEVQAGMQCSGNQCKVSTIVPERHSREVSVTVTAEGTNILEVTADAKYIIGDKERAMTGIAPLRIVLYNCGDGVCTKGDKNAEAETTENCCHDCGCPYDTGFNTYVCQADNTCRKRIKPMVIVVVVLVIILFNLIYVVAMRAFRYYETKWKMQTEHEKELREERKKEEQEIKEREERNRKEEEEREDIRTVLGRLEDEIDINHPPTAKTLLKKLKERFDFYFNEDIFKEEYFIFLDELDSRIKGRRIPFIPRKRPKFCTQCGYRLREGVNFCTICGFKVRDVE